jgi:hypothetical protein
MGFHDRAVDQMKPVMRLRRQPVENLLPDAAPRPTVEAIVYRRVSPIPVRQIEPRHPRPQHVENRVHHVATVSARPLLAPRHQRLQKSPFLIDQIKPHDPPSPTVNHEQPNFLRNYVSRSPNVPMLRHGRRSDAKLTEKRLKISSPPAEP